MKTYRRRPRRAYGRRRVRRTNPYRGRRMYKPRLYRPVGIPKQMFARLDYNTYQNFTLAPAGINYVEYRLNSLYDPEAAVGGTQPYYYGQYKQMYYKYLVYGCKVSVHLSANSANTNILYPSVVMAPYGGVSAPGWLNHLNMQNAKDAVWRQLVPSQNGTSFKKYFRCAEVCGVPKRTYNADDQYSANIGANPATPCNVQINCQNYDLSATVVVQIHIRLTYYCKLFDRIEPPPST